MTSAEDPAPTESGRNAGSSSISLRRRLSLAALLVSVSAVLACFLAAMLASSVLRSSFDDDLTEAVSVLEDALDSPRLSVTPSLAELLPPRYQALIVDSTGQVVSSSASTLELGYSPVGFANLDSHRVLTVQRPDKTTIRVAASTYDIDHALSVMLLSLLVASGVLVGLVCLAFVWVHRKGLRPLEEMARTAMSVASGDRSARVQEQGLTLEALSLARAINNLIAAEERAIAAEAQVASDQRRFLLDASHELRNPLTALVGWSKLLASGSVPPERQQEAYDRLSQESSRMQRLTEQLLALSRAESTTTAGAALPGDLAIALAGAVADHEVVDSSRAVTLDAPPSALVSMDPDACVQVVVNLLVNLRTHTPPGTSCRLTLENLGASWCLTYRDDGPGVEKPELIFDRFYQADPSRATSGTGLGLSLVRALVEQSGGTITASQGSPGLQLTLILPGAE